MRSVLIFVVTASLLASCGVNQSSFSPSKKYTKAQVEKDYAIYQRVLEAHHPGLYWYTSKDSMDYYFSQGRSELTDSMTEPAFRKILTYVTAKIDCGHTSIRTSKAWSKYGDTSRIRSIFPLSFKIWDSAAVITNNLHRNDSILTRGTIITRINSVPMSSIENTLFQYISSDGYNKTHKYQTLSNRSYFGSLYNSIYGTEDKYTIEYKDSLNQLQTVTIPVYNPANDTAFRRFSRAIRRLPQPSKKERKNQELGNVRLLKIDTANRTAMLDLASFGKGYGLKKFFRHSFKTLNKHQIGHLIIDVRSNGGGSVTNSTMLSRYMATQSFKVGDTLFAIKSKTKYDRYIQNNFWNKLFITFLTRKKSDGNHHFGFFERHYFKPKTAHHFDGKVYILTGGNSFSATTLFTTALMKQDNVTVVGEETGGGAYGNSAWLIPDVTLPETGVRFRLPLFRLVIDSSHPKNGRGVLPEVPSLPTVDAIRSNIDFKVIKAMELIEQDKNQQKK